MLDGFEHRMIDVGRFGGRPLDRRRRARPCCCCTATRRPAPAGTASRRRWPRRFTVVAADLRGYGESAKPPGGDGPRRLLQARDGRRPGRRDGARSATRGSRSPATTAAARVAHRMALDHPARRRARGRPRHRAHPDPLRGHRPGLRDGLLPLVLPDPARRPARDDDRPRPRVVPARDAPALVGPRAAARRGGDPRVRPRASRDPAAIHGSCEDYRAAATIDLEHDADDAGTPASRARCWSCGASTARCTASTTCSARWRPLAADVRGRPLPVRALPARGGAAGDARRARGVPRRLTRGRPAAAIRDLSARPGVAPPRRGHHQPMAGRRALLPILLSDSDASLARRAGAGDDAAFEVLVRPARRCARPVLPGGAAPAAGRRGRPPGDPAVRVPEPLPHRPPGLRAAVAAAHRPQRVHARGGGARGHRAARRGAPGRGAPTRARAGPRRTAGAGRRPARAARAPAGGHGAARDLRALESSGRPGDRGDARRGAAARARRPPVAGELRRRPRPRVRGRAPAHRRRRRQGDARALRRRPPARMRRLPRRPVGPPSPGRPPAAAPRLARGAVARRPRSRPGPWRAPSSCPAPSWWRASTIPARGRRRRRRPSARPRSPPRRRPAPRARDAGVRRSDPVAAPGRPVGAIAPSGPAPAPAGG